MFKRLLCFFSLLYKFKLTSVFSYEEKLYHSLSNYNLNHDVRLNDLVKITEERLAFIALPSSSLNWIYIFLIDLFDNYQNAKIRQYKENFDNKYQLQLEFAADVYNGHLIFTSTIIDVSIFFQEVDINNENSMFRFLRDRTPIENNIFGYEKLEYPVILCRFPPEMLFYNITSDSEILISGEDVLHENSVLKQNFAIRKTFKYYSLDYRLRVREREYDIFNSYAENIINNPSNSDQRSYFQQKILYGRVITLKFKLCNIVLLVYLIIYMIIGIIKKYIYQIVYQKDIIMIEKLEN